ncbi:hypothetical protein VPH35_098592 [Triticum aestivum]
MEEIYGKIAGGSYGCSRLAFQAYKHLKLLGYIVGRYGVPWTMICVKPYVAEQNYHRRYRSRNKPPSRDELETVEKFAGIRLKFCQVDNGRISLLSLDRVTLPTLP